jgi:hypothetical protein
MSEEVTEERIEQLLEELGIDRYNSETNIYRTWYGLNAKFQFSQKTSFSGGLSTSITIGYKNQHLESALGTTLHEIGHLELLPLDLILMPMFYYYFSRSFPSNNPYLGLLLPVLMYQCTIREMLAEIYVAVKIRIERWKNLWKLRLRQIID